MSLKLTPGGKDLLLRTLAGEASINFASVRLGNGADAGSSAAALSNPLLTVEISRYAVGDIYVTLTATFSNSDISAGFRATELGVYADDPDNTGSTLLYAYEYTPDAGADYIPASADKVLETQIDVLVYIGDAQNVTASISQSLVYAGKAELSEHIGDTSNPHKVTKENVGLGNVPNVSTNNQTPTYTAASTLTALTSGEKLSAAMGKLARAVSSLISHIGSKENPHEVKASQVGAAAASHKHSTTDITSGVLSAERGGTGVTSYADLRKKLSMPAISATSATLTADGWEGDSAPYTQTAAVSGVTADCIVDAAVAPAQAQVTEAGECMVLCTAQAAGTLTFTAFESKPLIALTYNVKLTKEA